MSGPTVFISYTHDSPEHKDAILALSEQLRHEGVDRTIDQYEQSPERGWPSWCEQQVAQSTFVLVACTETYLRRYKGEEAPNKGLGGTWEGHIITQELYNAQGKNTKFIPMTPVSPCWLTPNSRLPSKNTDSSIKRLSSNEDGLCGQQSRRNQIEAR